MAKEISPEASAHLDMIRAVAALAVVAGHIRSLFFVEYETLRQPGILSKLLYFVTGLGHQGVIVFFALSGLLVGGSVLRAIQARTWSWGAYALARLSRLYIVLIPGLILTAVLDAAGMAITHDSFIYVGTATFGNVINFSIESTHTWKDFFGTLFFVQTILTRPFGSNTPLWSLANEFWYYAAFPFAALALVRLRARRPSGALFSLAAVAISVFVGWGIVALFLVWLFGVVAFAWAAPGRPFPRWARIALAALATLQFAAVLVAAHLPLIHDPLLVDLMLGLSVAIGLWAILSLTHAVSSGRYARISKHWAGFSYTLYVVHLPLVVFIHGTLAARTDLFDGGRWHPDLRHLGLAAIILASVLFLAWFMAQLTERHTGAVRRAIARL